MLAGRYGNWERIKQTLAEDPVGLGLDAATVANLGTSAARTGGRMMMKTAGKILSPERLYQSALKPSSTLRPAERARLLETGIREKIAPTLAGHDKLLGIRRDVEGTIEHSIAALPSSPGISTAAVVRRADTLKPTFQATVDPQPLTKMLTTQQKTFTKAHGPTLSPTKAQEIKKNTYRQMDPKYGEMQWGPSEVKKAFARGIKEELESLYPELKTLNLRDQGLIELQQEIERAIGRINNSQIIGIGTPIGVEAGGALLGKPGAYAGLLRGILNQPTMKSRLAFALDRARKKASVVTPNPLLMLLEGTYQGGNIH